MRFLLLTIACCLTPNAFENPYNRDALSHIYSLGGFFISGTAQ